MNTNTYYLARAQAAYAAAEAANDPRDAAAWKAAAQTWERLAKPATEPTYSMEPHRLQLAALKRDVTEPLEVRATQPNTGELRRRELSNKALPLRPQPATIEF